MTKCHRIPEEVNGMISSFVVHQLNTWDLCRKNYSSLNDVRRRELPLGEFPSALQFNPGRIKSTGAKTDKKSIGARPCFLCRENRPEEQLSEDLDMEFEILVNPYPIFPLHFTVSSTSHKDQSEWPLQMISFAERMRGVCAFYNGARGGASAPDHLHFQGVADCEIPLIGLVEKYHASTENGLKKSIDFGIDLPFGFWSWVIPQGLDGMKCIADAMKCKGYDRKMINGSLLSTFKPEAATKDLINVYVWMDSSDKLRIVVIPRSAHRPDCYFAEDSSHHTVSPGAVDMAGVIILPEENDFESLTENDLRMIYSQTGLTSEEFAYLSDKLLH